MRILQQRLPKGEILDVGCGTGSLMLQLASKGYKVYGVDISDDCIRNTEERLKLFVPDMQSCVKRGNAEKIDYPDETFDAIIAAEVLEHVEDDHLAVREFYRLLKPCGICVVTVPANPQLWDISDEIAGHKRRYSEDDLSALFGSPSFQVEKILFWGFPLMRLYHRLVFLRWASHLEKKMEGTISSGDPVTRIGLNRWVTFILGNLFRVDDLFHSQPWGIGILLVARKGK